MYLKVHKENSTHWWKSLTWRGWRWWRRRSGRVGLRPSQISPHSSEGKLEYPHLTDSAQTGAEASHLTGQDNSDTTVENKKINQSFYYLSSASVQSKEVACKCLIGNISQVYKTQRLEFWSLTGEIAVKAAVCIRVTVSSSFPLYSSRNNIVPPLL